MPDNEVKAAIDRIHLRPVVDDLIATSRVALPLQAISKAYERSSQKTRRWRGRTTTIASRSTSRCARTA